MVIKQLGLIGCGLMGGSFALALKKAKLVKHIVGYSKSSNTMNQAKELGVIDESANSPLLATSGSDVVLIAVPVEATEATLKSICDIVTPNMLIMDVGSTKGSITRVAQRVLTSHTNTFVPCHPIAGKEFSGVAHAEADLYVDRNVILTPTEKTGDLQLKHAQEIWRAIGANIHQMSPEEHDTVFAGVSHLVHLIAFSYMQSITDQALREKLLAFAGPSFRDFTRIVASDATMWRDIFMANKTEVLRQSKQFQQHLSHFERLLVDNNASQLENELKSLNKVRRDWTL